MSFNTFQRFISNHAISYIKKWKQELLNSNVILSVFASLLVIVATLAGFGSGALEKYKEHYNERDNKFVGIWTNPSEGCIGCSFDNDQERPIILKLEVVNGQIIGEMDASGWLSEYRKERDLKTRRIPKRKPTQKERKQNDKAIIRMVLDSLHKNLLVEGDLIFNQGNITITDFYEGKRVLFGKAKLSMQDNFMKMEMVGKHFLGIPDKAHLYKVYNNQGSPCTRVNEETPWLCQN